ncbi:hypothetical protein Goshw_012988 [Gossypium schwendimanii]|uniref:Uncharacterized protein n=1 Tax=Gossypium schwendimanii TaxID=34291 RepID=A0A7J9LNW2_GOSSC|nr:hypothetical protein [Gossypium schwendimanii]
MFNTTNGFDPLDSSSKGKIHGSNLSSRNIEISNGRERDVDILNGNNNT